MGVEVWCLIINVLTQIFGREIKAQYLFEKETSEIKYPQWQDGSFSSDFNIGLHSYISLLKIPSMDAFDEGITH